MLQYKKVGLGGTFDQLHKGHRKLLRKALEVGEVVLVGLTTDEVAKSIRKHKVASFNERRRELEEFFKREGAEERIRIVPLNDPYGPTITNEEIEAIVVSEETAWRARKINELRRKGGLKPLKIIVIDMVLAEDQKPITTTRIRSGEVDREGCLL